MNKLIIKKHDFEKAKRGLKEFSQKKVDELKIDTVRTNGGFQDLVIIRLQDMNLIVE